MKRSAPLLVVCVPLLALAPACNRGHTQAAPAPSAAAPAVGATAGSGPALPGMATMRVGSCAFELEIAGLYDRYQDPKTAGEHFARAITACDQPAQLIQAHTGVARLREAQGDREGAIAALERAVAETARMKAAAGGAGGAGPGLAAGPMGGEDLTLRLAQLYLAAGKLQVAGRLYDQALAGAKEPWRRDQILRAQIEAYRQDGSLAGHVAEREKTLAADKPDEDALRFLAIVYGAGGPAWGSFVLSPAGASPPGPAAAGAAAPASAPAPQVDKLIRVYEKLLALHPGDAEMRRGLVQLYETAKRTDDALALVRRAVPEAPGAGAAPGAAPGAGAPTPGGAAAGGPAAGCPGNLAARMQPPRLRAAEDAVRILLRAGQKDQALAETGKLLGAGAASDGVGAALLAADLYAEQGWPDLAQKAVTAADKAARTIEDRRAVAVVRAEVLRRSGRTAELAKLLEQWRKAEDQCLRAEAERRERSISVTLPGPAAAPARP
ncbi:MAG TPA: tetratricopeptide repeat protein [Polyangia bacterium]